MLPFYGLFEGKTVKNAWYAEIPGYLGPSERPTAILAQPIGIIHRTTTLRLLLIGADLSQITNSNYEQCNVSLVNLKFVVSERFI